MKPVHGESHPQTPEYQAWCSMRKRCSNPQARDYKHYGARGIKVCPEWDDYEQFRRDMGERPKGYTLDRVDTNGDYSKANCRWTTWAEQKRNTTRSIRITCCGETMVMSDWADRLHVHRATFSGWVRKHGGEKAVLLGKEKQR